MTKILVVNDPHIADHPPVGRIDDYASHILAKLDEIREMAIPMGVHAVVFTGDLYHQKRPSRVSHRLVNRLLVHFLGYPPGISRLTILGNHDLTSDGIAGVSHQPIWTLQEAQVLHIMLTPVVYDGICLVPRHWDEERAADPDYYALTPQERRLAGQHTVVVAHGPLLPPGATPRVYESLSVKDIDLDGIDAIVSGHCHEDLGIHYADGSKKKHFANLGSISRVARTVSNMARKPSVLLIESDGADLRLTRHHLKSVLPAGEVFEGQPSGETEGLDDALAQFVQRFSAGLRIEHRDVRELLAEYGDLSRDELKLAIRYLEESGLL